MMEVRCVGLAFTEEKDKVLLIKKNSPEWQAGKLNGIGGRVEADECAGEAIMRECEESVGLVLPWRWYCTIEHPRVILYAYKAFSDDVYNARTITAAREFVSFISVDILRNLSTLFVDDLRYLIPAALDNDTDYDRVKEMMG